MKAFYVPISLCVLYFVVSCTEPSSQILTFDMRKGNAATEIIIPHAIPEIDLTTRGSKDAPLAIRISTLLTNAWFDASAPYHESAVGIYSDLGRRVGNPDDNTEINIAILFASYHVLNSLFPNSKNKWNTMMLSLGLDPTDTSSDLTTPIGIGNEAGMAVVQARENDGMNQLGNHGGRKFNTMAYYDYTGFKPANTAYELTLPSLWQPAVTTNNFGVFSVQQFITPQLRLTVPYSYQSPSKYSSPVPQSSLVSNFDLYRVQVNEVIDASALLTDEQKLYAEFFDSKTPSLGFTALFAAETMNLNILEFIHYDFAINMALFDTMITIWNEKFKHNAVRPFSAIRHVYDDQEIRAWGGVGNGIVDNLPANQWISYLNVADHPEYPSASASFCAAQAEISRLVLKNDQLNYRKDIKKGASEIEPNITPSTKITLFFSTWSEFEEICGNSRFWAGVHFKFAVSEGQKLGKEVATDAFQFLQNKIKPPTN